jgi:serine/threonine protein phosphatase PrpC
MLPAIELATRSDPGRDPEKQVNEDACGHRETIFGHLCVVCDGMGGHAGGREASNLALATILDYVSAAPADARPPDVLRDALAAANLRVHAMATNDQGRPGSTVVAILVHSGGAEVAHVGDSRGYLVHGSQVFQITKDHSMVQELVDAGFLTPAQAAVHPNANQITRALGMKADVNVEVRTQPLRFVAGDAFVLCSDGLSDLVEPHEILQTVGSAPAAQAAGNLVDLANARGGYDNITVLIARPRENASSSQTVVMTTVAESQPPPPPLVDRSQEATLRDGEARTAQQPVYAEPPPQTVRAAPSPLVPPAPIPAFQGGRGSTLPGARRRWSTVEIATITIAGIGIALLLALLYMHLSDRGGRAHAPSTLPPPFRLDAGRDAP